MYKFLLKPILFLFPPEFIHHLVTSALSVSCKIPGIRQLIRASYIVSDDRLKKELFGLTFKNPVGLAAGFDKNAKFIDGMECLGFGFVEIGTVTPKPQPGNDKPRMFRLAPDEGLINRMGFNNDGAAVIAARLRRVNSKVIIGGNIGKNKATPNEEAIEDYTTCFDKLFDHVDYFVVNVSSPNTPGLRELQDKEPLKRILSRIQELNNNKPKRKPVLLKIAPDLSNEQLDDIIEIVNETKLDGVVATNTTIDRNNLKSSHKQVETYGEGGLSGKPLTDRSTEVIKYLADKSQKSFPIIGVGGIHSPEDAIAKLKAGADLVQIYTGFIYEGASLVRRINKRILSVYN